MIDNPLGYILYRAQTANLTNSLLYLDVIPQNSIPLTTPKLLSKIVKVSLKQDGSLVLLRELEKKAKNNGR